MKRILLMVLRNLWFVPYGWFKLCYTAAHVEKYTEEERYQVLKMIDRRANIGGRITIDAYGVENIPEQDGFMFFPNHQGLYDVLAILEVCPRPFSVVMKKEVENVPFLKQVFACMKAIPLDRNDLRQGLQVIKQVAEEVKEGRNYLIFAEGTSFRILRPSASILAASSTTGPLTSYNTLSSLEDLSKVFIVSASIRFYFLLL